MTYAATKEKLHHYIEHGHENKVMAIYTLLANEMEKENFDYSPDLEQLSNDAFSGKSKIFTAEESMENIRQRRKKSGI